MEKLTIQEEEAMIYIWELGSCFVKDIVAKYPNRHLPTLPWLPSLKTWNANSMLQPLA